MSAPTFQFKSLRELKQMSEETICFVATLYVDGVRVAQLENRGFGASTNVTPVSSDPKVRQLLDRAREFALTQTWTYDSKTHNHTSLDSYLDVLVADELARRDIDRQFKRHMKVHCLFLTGEGLFTLPRPYLAAMGEALRREHGPDVVILNELPEAEGRALFEKHAAEPQ
ncbi:hypothetical protein [Rhodanobacter denitrificans]|uniref:hypothetical protein n=1 Tax=Rhodanobacter denitrificans TaxID=666685 RepID=UPI001F4351B2|nr:hypothetical protein [Rhodanobacter denitrificans]UJJ60600.1 hypothetical protein LRK55_19390 [Rhodanobacter denitrificans]